MRRAPIGRVVSDITTMACKMWVPVPPPVPPPRPPEHCSAYNELRDLGRRDNRPSLTKLLAVGYKHHAPSDVRW